MEMIKTKKGKFLVILIVFMMMFSNFGYTLSVIATSEEFQVISNGFFKKNEIKFNAYFENENGKKTNEITGNVNQKLKLVLEILPQVNGYLKSGTIKVVSSNEKDLNLKISDASIKEESNIISKPVVDTNSNTVNMDSMSNTVEENTNTNSILNIVVENKNTISEDTNTVSNTIVENSNTVSENTNTVLNNTNTLQDTMVNSDNTVSNPLVAIDSIMTSGTDEVNNVSDETAENPAVISAESEEGNLIDEEAVIEEKTEEINQEKLDIHKDINFVSEDEIVLSNITSETKIEVNVEYIQCEELDIENLEKEIKLQLSGTFINSDLEEVEIGKEEKVKIGWTYTKDISLTSEYTKFSPFEIGEIKGTIVENKITVKREIEEEKYLPVRSSKLEIEVPKVNGKAPINVDVVADKLLASMGEDTGKTSFGKENWKYDEKTGKINIEVTNEKEGKAVNTKGIDEYIVIYRYEDYVESENSNLSKIVKLEVEEYSAKKNNIIKKEIKENQDIKVDVGELVTYSISSTEGKINKGKIYANYNSENGIYETEYTTQVNVNILTSDILESLKIDSTKEVYKADGVELEAKGIEYRKIKFSYAEISSILSEGGEIVITNENGELLYTLNSTLITKEEDCTINLNGANGIIITANNIAKNGTINFEITKSIRKCNYDKAVFKNIKEIESRITAEVKYAEIDETLKLATIGTRKEFEEAATSANLIINKESLSTINANENVELKIELNNDKETSDLYINPTFEMVFPKYVKGVSVESINLLYENGLKVKDFQTYTESDIVKMRVELGGMQSSFSQSSATNGTNIIINTNIEVDDYTPSKEDQIKLYYCNEGASNYQSQTKWTINKEMPAGILKTTNGFDVAIINYQAPSGLVTINGIINYDGNLGAVKSVKQGEITREIPINSSSKIVTMELLALNNTGNRCSDVVLIGRIPFKGVRDVIANEEIGSTTDTVVRDLIKEDIQNKNLTTIYYSSNPNANKNLDDISNGWVEGGIGLTEIKSYLIVVKGGMEPGQVLRYTYDFEIPENLPYEAKIEGSFGGFYNNNAPYAIVYESSIADRVGLTTELGPKLEATMTVDIGDGADVYSNRPLKYTIQVSNPGSVVANDVVVSSKVPERTNVTKKESSQYGDYGYTIGEKTKEITYNLGTINPGEVKEYSFTVRTGNKPTLDEYAEKDEKGYFIITGYDYEEVPVEKDPMIDADEFENEGEDGTTKVPVPIKEYITEVPNIYITSKATVTTSMNATPVETNEVKNELKQANFATEIRIDHDRNLRAGMASNFELALRNTARKDLKNVVAVLTVGDIYEYKEGSISDLYGEITSSGQDGKIEFKEQEGKIYFYVGDLDKDDVNYLRACVITKGIKDFSKTVDCYFEISADETLVEKSTVIPQTVDKAILEAKDISINMPNSINENENIIISTEVKNIANIECTEGTLEFTIPEEMTIHNVTLNGVSLSIEKGNNKAIAKLPIIDGKETITVDIILKAKNMPGTDNKTVTVERIVHNSEQEDIKIEPVGFTIINNEKTAEEKEQERIEDLKKQEEEDKKKPSSNNNSGSNNNGGNNNNNSSNSNNNNSSNNSNNSSNNSNNNNSNSSSNNGNKKPNNNNSSNNGTTTTIPTYSINGLVWLDLNKNGVREDDEKGISGVKAYLLTTDNNMVQSTATTSSGTYQFRDVKPGKYMVALEYEKDKYIVTSYKKANTPEDRISVAIDNNSDKISAITNEIIVENANIGNINIGLQNKDTFDLAVNKYISNVKVTTKKDVANYDFDNLDVAKVEIPAKKLKGAKVDFEYTIVIENTGNIEGYAEQLVDYLGDEITFEEGLNTDWFKGNDGYVYAKDLNQTMLQPGDKKELKLTVSKIMNENNTGTVSNKITLLNAFNQYNSKELIDNNTSIQNTLILISTGYTVQIIGAIIAIIFASFIIYKNKEKITILVSSNVKYKTKQKVKKKIKLKKKYK